NSVATLTVNNKVTLTYTFPVRIDAIGIQHYLNDGMVGIGARNSIAQIDNVAVQRVPLPVALTQTVDFSSGTGSLLALPESGSWQVTTDGHYVGTAFPGNAAVDLEAMSTAPSSMVDLTAKLNTNQQGGITFDLYSPLDFKYVVLSAGQLSVGHRT